MNLGVTVLERRGYPAVVRAETELDGRIVCRAGEMSQCASISGREDGEPAFRHRSHVTFQVAGEINLRLVMFHEHRPAGDDLQVG